MRRLLLTMLIAGMLRQASGQAQYVSFRIDSAVRAAIAEKHIPGMQVAVVKYGLVLKKGNYGFANLEDRMPVTDSTVFSIASMSKMFTDAAILLLMEDGKLDLDDPISKYFDSLPSAWEGITIRRLMNHSSGLRDDWDENNDFFYTKRTDSAFFAALKQAPLKFKPGEAINYGCGPFVLGMVIGKISGESYPDFMKHRIFDKLGMKNTMINNADSIIANRAAGYRMKDSVLIHGVAISAAAQARGDVGVLTTAPDMLKWLAAIQDSSLLKRSSIELMFTPGVLNDSSKTISGFGWFLMPFRDHLLYAHGGSFRTGYNSTVFYFPEDHVGVIILSNLWGARVSQIATQILGIFNADYGTPSKMQRPAADPDSVRTLLLKSFYTELGLNVDTTRKMARELHIPHYYTEEELDEFRNVEEFNFIRAIKPSKPIPDIFGDTIQGIYLYEIKCKNQPVRYDAFFVNMEGKVVYIGFEE